MPFGEKPGKSSDRPLPPPQDLAFRIVSAIRSGNLAAAFIQSYAAHYDRQEFLVHAERSRELQSILEREILLAAASHVLLLAEDLWRQGRSSKSTKRLADPARFVRDFIAAVGLEKRWTAGDVVEFRGEFGLYQAIAAAGAAKASGVPRSFRRNVAGGPFVDRCAFLLDPSMMENARQAAAKLLREIEALVSQEFARVFPPAGSGKTRASA